MEVLEWDRAGSTSIGQSPYGRYSRTPATNMQPPLPPSPLTRQAPSPNLSAVAAFSQTRQAMQNGSVEELSDPPPPSMLTTTSTASASSSASELTATSSNTRTRPPSSRTTLTRALALAREAVQLDAANDNPEAAIQAYGHSVALLSEVMERVRRGEDSTESGRRRISRRSPAAQEEEVRRLQSIHDTYADRMNILSIIYSIPPIPYPSTYPDPNSPTTSTSPSSDTSEHPPLPNVGSRGHVPELDGREAIGSAMFTWDDSPTSPTTGDIPGLPQSSTFSHPYASAAPPIDHLPQTVVTPPAVPPNRTSMISRRSRGGSAALPPPPPPPSDSLPPAPVAADPSIDGLPPAPQPSLLQVGSRQRGEPVGHRRTSSGSKLPALQEERGATEDAMDRGYDSAQRTAVPDMSRQRPDPLPSPLPPNDPNVDSPTPRNSVMQRPPPSPRPNIIVPRPRGSSTIATRSEYASHQAQQMLIINTSTDKGSINVRRAKTSAPADSRSSSPADSTTSSSAPGSSASSAIGITRSRSSSQPGRQPLVLAGGRVSPFDQRPPLPPPSQPPNGSPTLPSLGPRKNSISAKYNPLSVQTDLVVPTPPVFGPTTPTSPLPPQPPGDPLRKPYHMMNLLRSTMESSSGGYVTRRLHVPQEVWSQGGAKLSNTLEKVRVVGILCQALEELQMSSSESFGAGNVSSGLALGIGSIGRREAESWIAKLDDFSSVCEGVVANFGKKLGVGEGFVLKKSTLRDQLTRRFDKFTNGKNLDSPAAYVQGLRRLFLYAQLLDEHTKAILTSPVAPSYSGFPPDMRSAVESKLKRTSQFFASVVLTFVIRDLSQLLDKYAKKCEKWLAE